jgi:DNA-binding NarL/FixJ family response regulator
MAAILVVDDHPVVLQGLRHFISEDIPGATVVAAQSATDALRELGRARFKLIVLDLVLPGRGGLEFLTDLHRAYPQTPILVLSILPEEHYAARALRAGAAGYLNKAVDRRELVQAMQKTAAGEKYISAVMARKIALAKVQPSRSDTLSNREYEILSAIGSGKKLTAIARDLVLSVKTVSTHKRRLMAKLGITNDAELIRYAADQGFPQN